MNSIPAFHYSRPVSRNGVPGAPADFLLTEGWMDGMGWMDGWDGTEYQKCPSIFFILCGYIDKLNTYLYILLKIVPNILMGFKILCQVEDFEYFFQNYNIYVFLKKYTKSLDFK